jgi:hypothetical protein
MNYSNVFNINFFKIIISIALFSSCNSRINRAEEIQELNLENELAAMIKDFKGEAHLYAKNLSTGEIINIELYGKAGFTPGYRGDVAYFITPDSEYVIGLKCTNVDDSKPLNATNEGFEFSAKLGKLFYDHWGFKESF